MQLNWIFKAFDELTTNELYSILQLRSEVFVVEQNCIYQDLDGKDGKSHHLMAFNGSKLCAYTRILAPGVSFAEASIGRVITAEECRGKGIGIELMKKSIAMLYNTYGKQPIKIGAQLYLQKFYESFGFVKCSEQYLEDGILHIEMTLS